MLRDYPNIDYSNYNFLDQKNNKIGDELAYLRAIKRHSDVLSITDDIKKNFEKNNFHKIRHQSIAHRNIDLQEPAGAGWLLIKNKYIFNLHKIIKEIKMIVNFGFDYELNNPQTNVMNWLRGFLKENYSIPEQAKLRMLEKYQNR